MRFEYSEGLSGRFYDVLENETEGRYVNRILAKLVGRIISQIRGIEFFIFFAKMIHFSKVVRIFCIYDGAV